MSSFSFLNGDVEDVVDDTDKINGLLTHYREKYLGTGLYAQLRILEQQMSLIALSLPEQARNSEEGQAFISALNELKALHKSEANIKSQLAIEEGTSTKAKEEAKKENYEVEREYMEIEPLSEAGFNFLPVLLIGGAIVGGYLVFKG